MVRLAAGRLLRRSLLSLAVAASLYGWGEWQSPQTPAAGIIAGTCSEGGELDAPLLVLATTMVEPLPNQKLSRFKHRSQLTGLYGMLAQTPAHAVLPTVFSKSPQLAELIRAAPGLNDSSRLRIVSDGFRSMLGTPHHHGWPLFSDVMAGAEEIAVQLGAPFFGYANADILFSEDLVLTLRMLSAALNDGYFAQFDFGGSRKGNHKARRGRGAPGGLLVIGRRINVEFEGVRTELRLG